jgi:transposase
MSQGQVLERQELEKLEKSSLIELIVVMQAQLTKQSEQIQKLSDQIAKNSRNSGKPPGSDGLKKMKTQSLRQKGERPFGGQPGHTGDTLKMVVEADKIVNHPVTSCPHCQHDLRAVEAIDYDKRQVFDIPALQLEVTEHRVAIKECPGCGHAVSGRFPESVSQPTQYGERLKAQASYLNTYHFIPLARTAELLSDFYGQAPSEAALIAANEQAASQIQPSLTTIQEQLIAAEVVNCDESGLRVEGKLQWLHVACTPTLTFYQVDAKRGQVGMQAAGILDTFAGVAVHDHWASYLAFENCQHAFCNAHHLRELRFIFEQYQQPWAETMAQLLRTIKREVDSSPLSATALPIERLTYYSAEYDKLITQGLALNPTPAQPALTKRGRPKQSPPKNLLDRLQTHKSGVLAFMADFRIPFDNNQAERDVRMIKVKQKVSGSFRTLTGAQTFTSIRAYISTARKHGINAIDALYKAFLGQPFIPKSIMA